MHAKRAKRNKKERVKKTTRKESEPSHKGSGSHRARSRINITHKRVLAAVDYVCRQENTDIYDSTTLNKVVRRLEETEFKERTLVSKFSTAVVTCRFVALTLSST